MSAATRDAVAATVLGVAPAILLASVVGIVVTLASRVGAVAWLPFLWEGPQNAGRGGGIFPFLIATAWVLGIALGIAIPLGLAAAVWMVEFAGSESRGLSAALDAIAAMPSVIFGLFGMALFCEALGLGWSVLAGGLTMAGMVLPLFVLVAVAGLRAVPAELRLAGAALGLGRATIVGRILLPHAAPTLGAGLVLAVGRVLAESAALMFTAGASIRVPTTPLEPGRVLAYHVYLLATEVPGGMSRACASALVLVVLAGAAGALARALPRWLVRR